MQPITTIRITKETREKLVSRGKKNETYNDLILRILDKDEPISQ